MSEKNRYIRARIAAIEHQLRKYHFERDEKNNDGVVFRNGVIPSKYETEARQWIEANQSSFSNEPLKFTEITRFNSWFTLYPDKQAGLEVVTTSREFPIQIRGNDQDIIETITRFLTESPVDRTRIVKAKAVANAKILKLLDLGSIKKK
jgi:hypothetical protein